MSEKDPCSIEERNFCSSRGHSCMKSSTSSTSNCRSPLTRCHRAAGSKLSLFNLSNSGACDSAICRATGQCAGKSCFSQFMCPLCMSSPLFQDIPQTAGENGQPCGLLISSALPAKKLVYSSLIPLSCETMERGNSTFSTLKLGRD